MDPLQRYEHNVFSEDEDEGVIGDLDMDDGNNDFNHYGAKRSEGYEPFNDDSPISEDEDEGHDGEARENIENEDDIGIFD